MCVCVSVCLKWPLRLCQSADLTTVNQGFSVRVCVRVRVRVRVCAGLGRLLLKCISLQITKLIKSNQ